MRGPESDRHTGGARLPLLEVVRPRLQLCRPTMVGFQVGNVNAATGFPRLGILQLIHERREPSLYLVRPQPLRSQCSGKPLASIAKSVVASEHEVTRPIADVTVTLVILSLLLGSSYAQAFPRPVEGQGEPGAELGRVRGMIRVRALLPILVLRDNCQRIVQVSPKSEKCGGEPRGTALGCPNCESELVHVVRPILLARGKSSEHRLHATIEAFSQVGLGVVGRRRAMLNPKGRTRFTEQPGSEVGGIVRD